MLATPSRRPILDPQTEATRLQTALADVAMDFFNQTTPRAQVVRSHRRAIVYAARATRAYRDRVQTLRDFAGVVITADVSTALRMRETLQVLLRMRGAVGARQVGR